MLREVAGRSRGPAGRTVRRAVGARDSDPHPESNSPPRARGQRAQARSWDRGSGRPRSVSVPLRATRVDLRGLEASDLPEIPGKLAHFACNAASRLPVPAG